MRWKVTFIQPCLSLTLVLILGSLSNDDEDANENGKKKFVWISKTTTLHVLHAFCTFLCRRCLTTTWKYLISHFVVDENTRQRLSFSFHELWYSPLNSTEEKFANSLETERDGISVKNFEAVRIQYFLVSFSKPLLSLLLKLTNIFVKNEASVCHLMVSWDTVLQLRGGEINLAVSGLSFRAYRGKVSGFHPWSAGKASHRMFISWKLNKRGYLNIIHGLFIA